MWFMMPVTNSCLPLKHQALAAALLWEEAKYQKVAHDPISMQSPHDSVFAWDAVTSPGP